MLPKKKRLIKKKDFAAVYQKGRAYHSEDRSITVKCLKNRIKTIRMGFVVGKNYSKKATERNKARRLLRAVFHQNLGLIKPEYDIIVLYNKKGRKVKQPKYDELMLQAKEVIKKIK